MRECAAAHQDKRGTRHQCCPIRLHAFCSCANLEAWKIWSPRSADESTFLSETEWGRAQGLNGAHNHQLYRHNEPRSAANGAKYRFLVGTHSNQSGVLSEC